MIILWQGDRLDYPVARRPPRVREGVVQNLTTSEVVLQWLPFQTPGFMESLSGQACPIPVCCDCMRLQDLQLLSRCIYMNKCLGRSVYEMQFVNCCDIQQPTNKSNLSVLLLYIQSHARARTHTHTHTHTAWSLLTYTHIHTHSPTVPHSHTPPPLPTTTTIADTTQHMYT